MSPSLQARKNAVERVRKWRLKNPEKLEIQRKKYREKHREIRNIKGLERYYSKKEHCLAVKAKWRLANKEKVAKYNSEWEIKNRNRANAKAARRRAIKQKASPKWANQFFIDEIYDLAQRRSAMKCGGHEKWHVDHIVPLKSKLVCGLHVEHNLQVIPGIENMKKHNRWWPNMPEHENA